MSKMPRKEQKEWERTMKDLSDDLPEWKRKLHDHFIKSEKPAPLQFPTDPVPTEADIAGTVAHGRASKVLEGAQAMQRLLNGLTEQNAFGSVKAYDDLAFSLIFAVLDSRNDVRKWVRILGGY
jgi:hypothetical protein